MNVAAIFHLWDVTGPAKSLRPRLESITRGGGSLSVISPAQGSLAAAYGGLGEVRLASYEPLMMPTSLSETLRTPGRLREEVRALRTELRRARPDLVVVVTAVLPAALLAARLERLPTVTYVGELFAKGYVNGVRRALGGRAVARLCERLSDRLLC